MNLGLALPFTHAFSMPQYLGLVAQAEAAGYDTLWTGEVAGLAGEIADGVLLNWIPPEAVPQSIRQIEIGAKRAGRNLADFEIAAFIRTSVTDDPEAARQWLARDITGYAIVDSYGRFFAECGFAKEVEAVSAAWKTGDRGGAVKQISATVIRTLQAVAP